MSNIITIFTLGKLKKSVMKNFVKKSVFAVLAFFAILLTIGFDPDQFWYWLKLESIFVGGAWFWWWITDLKEVFDNDPEFKEDKA